MAVIFHGFIAAELREACTSLTFTGMQSKIYQSRYKIVILVIVLLVAVYAVSQYVRRHEATESISPGPINAPVNESAGSK